MRIQRFVAAGIHGYLNFNIEFQSDLTFLTGINGSGKTSVVQSLVALISPDFFVLCHMNFQLIEVLISHNEQDLTLRAFRFDDGNIQLEASGAGEPLVIGPYSPDPDESPIRQREREVTYYQQLHSALRDNQVMQVINKLPTPMFLDLDRRARDLQQRRYPRYSISTIKRARNIFSPSLTQSLEAATALAENVYRDTLIEVGRLGEPLRRETIFDLLELESPTFGLAISLPTAEEVNILSSMRKSIESLPYILQIPREEIEKRLIPTLNTLEGFAKELPRGSKIQKIISRSESDEKKFNALVGWSSSRPQLQKLLKMVERVKNYNAQREEKLLQSSNYIKIIGTFLKDSDKYVFFDESGYLGFRIAERDEVRPMTSLSSGEGQLFVIFSHLFFNPLAQAANVFIVDEPELSLHVQWQELFVDSVLEANPNIQYIMATHSPSIIMDRLESCRDLSRANDHGIRG